ncbi:hypothetical protein L1F30_12005 [Simiduia sp. 21SJ11W-1]|uniref:hypothetical protein n=1 Tax=Simiduia sp. 21SJ11W-1 TaxID=2909669 RepID=UPI00209F21C5|nr:hypothetical protein [Simiduia sp. 21SJ11W-1]UTA46885.1 hypothetical protein L1F30_12005 [Simiduia sp. 21SJ11W-1]
MRFSVGSEGKWSFRLPGGTADAAQTLAARVNTSLQLCIAFQGDEGRMRLDYIYLCADGNVAVAMRIAKEQKALNKHCGFKTF